MRAYADPEGEDAEQVDTAQRFERALFGAYYAACERAGGDFLRAWSEFDRTLRNIAAAVSARAAGRNVGEAVVGGGDVAEQLQRSSASDFGLRGELSYIDAVIAAVNEEANLVEKERKIDRIRWREAEEPGRVRLFRHRRHPLLPGAGESGGPLVAARPGARTRNVRAARRGARRAETD